MAVPRKVRRRESPVHSFQPFIDRTKASPVVRQLYLSLRKAILTGQIPPASRLPSTRLASMEWELSRGVVAEAYDILITEGYAHGVHGAGTFVATSIPAQHEKPEKPRQQKQAERTISSAARNALACAGSFDTSTQVPFVTGRVVHDERTSALLRRLSARHLNFSRDHYRHVQGQENLREAIVAYLTASRSVRCDASQIFITSGTQQAIDLVARTLVTPGDRILTEDPCYPGARHAFALNGAELAGVEVDENGLQTSLLPQLSDGVRAIYVTPSHQYPAGAAMSLPRRLALLNWARDNHSWIIEDDYDSEFRYNGRPLASLQGLDENDRVIYLGTFSKALLPSFRVGYAVVPRDLVPAFAAVRPFLDRFPPPFQQSVLADFLTEGYFSSHLRRLRESYRKSRDLLVATLQEQVADHLTVTLPHQGIHLVGRSTGTWQGDHLVASACAARGVKVMPVSPMHVSTKPRDGLLLGFSALTSGEAESATARLRAALDEVARTGAGSMQPLQKMITP
ncbi:PLP-dependent aminotransferase family protein [Phyllobacterium myrsinacearum]|uniref:GntR family transcriptional regulator/MocR family aminotransferase n=1 Tax=Phyllobacterium myrsinacearum TaxID=28101 RepID=A0A839EJ14_9HYPH|nr:PLP-dependent aminotransferase family protein [Phyllobacterium myrsinacearum]MBA8876750.1 GntR family transcriptional regulator/MocR family aminotransferase [Phyllobacterium myrsinacearum]